jgi:hypothetical protein
LSIPTRATPTIEEYDEARRCVRCRVQTKAACSSVLFGVVVSAEMRMHKGEWESRVETLRSAAQVSETRKGRDLESICLHALAGVKILEVGHQRPMVGPSPVCGRALIGSLLHVRRWQHHRLGRMPAQRTRLRNMESAYEIRLCFNKFLHSCHALKSIISKNHIACWLKTPHPCCPSIPHPYFTDSTDTAAPSPPRLALYSASLRPRSPYRPAVAQRSPASLLL